MLSVLYLKQNISEASCCVLCYHKGQSVYERRSKREYSICAFILGHCCLNVVGYTLAWFVLFASSDTDFVTYAIIRPIINLVSAAVQQHLSKIFMLTISLNDFLAASTLYALVKYHRDEPVGGAVLGHIQSARTDSTSVRNFVHFYLLR